MRSKQACTGKKKESGESKRLRRVRVEVRAGAKVRRHREMVPWEVVEGEQT